MSVEEEAASLKASLAARGDYVCKYRPELSEDMLAETFEAFPGFVRNAPALTPEEYVSAAKYLNSWFDEQDIPDFSWP